MEKGARLYLVRHGQVEGYERVPIYGHTDVLLTEMGILQSEKIAERLRFTKIQAVYSSDLMRGVMGARIIGRHHNVPHHVFAELREIHFGDWEGLGLQDVRLRFPEEIRRRMTDPVNFRSPGEGETIAELSQRVMSCFQDILCRQEGREFLIVGHAAVNRVILCNALGLDLAHMFRLHQNYGCLNVIDYLEDSTVVRLING
ncbi:MAG: histidine phosphatase family protein [Deltaproteobacteria bacterium]|nr:histidine phosphatase family protein [Deltaproteobacteria bacterium]